MSRQPRKHKSTFEEVLYSGDQTSVRQLVKFLLTDSQKSEMVRLFNKCIDQYSAEIAKQDAVTPVDEGDRHYIDT